MDSGVSPGLFWEQDVPRQQLSPPLPLPAPGSAPAAACHPTQASFWAMGSSGAQCVGLETIWDLYPHPHHSYLAEPCLPVQRHTPRDKSQVREAALNSIPPTTATSFKCELLAPPLYLTLGRLQEVLNPPKIEPICAGPGLASYCLLPGLQPSLPHLPPRPSF